MHDNLILPASHKLRDIRFPSPVHIVAVKHLRSVDFNIRKGIDPIAEQDQPLHPLQFGIQLKASPIVIILFGNLHGIDLIFPIEGILDQPGIQQILVYRSRDLRRDPVVGIRRFEFPGSV